jgi:hypothetical protein
MLYIGAMSMTSHEEPAMLTKSATSPAINPQDDPAVEPASCKICGCDTTGWCLHGQDEHKSKHFDDVNTKLPVRNDLHGARIYTYHDMNFSRFTKYGKCLVLGGLLNSEFPNDVIIDPRDISALSRLRYLLMSAIMVGDDYNIAIIAAERHEIGRVAAVLFQNENWMHLVCCRLAADLQS